MRMALPRRRTGRSPLLLRVLVACGVGLVLFLYYRPLKSYLATSKEVAARQAEVASLSAQRRTLEHKLALSATQEELAREARRIGYVRPGERLYIVKGIDGWYAREQAALKAAARAARSAPAR